MEGPGRARREDDKVGAGLVVDAAAVNKKGEWICSFEK